MIPQPYITAWRAHAPWIDDAQVEHDLVLSRALVDLFSLPELTGKIALRGGTALNKLFIPKAARYSEDIDLVQVSPAPIGPLIEVIRARLDPWLGTPGRGSSEKMFTLTYRFNSEITPVRPLKLKLEINTREHFSVLGYDTLRFTVDTRWFTGHAQVSTFKLDELMGTKLRALYQRKKGRDLFDLWLCLDLQYINPQAVVECFRRYMQSESHPVSRATFEKNLAEKVLDNAFLQDIRPLLASHIQYDPEVALRVVKKELIDRLP